MRQMRGTKIMLRVLGGILLVVACLTIFRRWMYLQNSVMEDVAPLTAAFYIHFFLPSILMFLGGIGCFIAAKAIGKITQ